MAKKYFHTFGFSGSDKEWLISELSKLLGVEFHLTSGERYVYNFGGVGNRVSIFNNYLEEDDWWQESDYKEFSILVKISLVDLDQTIVLQRIESELEKVEYLTKIRSLALD